MKHVLTYSLICLLCFSLVSCKNNKDNNETEDYIPEFETIGLDYQLTDYNGVKCYSVIGYTGDDTSIVIPKKHDDIPVLIIDDEAFYDNDNILEVTFNSNLKKIGNNAFQSCKNISKINIPDSVKEIGSYAFSGLSSLNEFKLPKDLVSIPDGLFSACINLKKVVIQEGIKEIGQDAFTICQSLEELHLPSSIKSIESEAFTLCNIKNVYYEGTLTDWIKLDKKDPFDSYNIKTNDSFNGYYKIPKEITKLKDYAFRRIKNLKKIYIPKTVKTLGKRVFNDIPDLVIETEYESNPSNFPKDWNCGHEVIYGVKK